MDWSHKVILCPTSIHCVIRKNPNDPDFRVHVDTLKPHLWQITDTWKFFDDPINDILTESDIESENIENPDIFDDFNRNDVHTESDHEYEDTSDSESTSRPQSPIGLGRGKRFRKPPNRYSP